MYHIHVGGVLKDCEDSESRQAQPMSLVTAHKENKNPVKNPFPTTPLNLSGNQVPTSIRNWMNLIQNWTQKQTRKTERGI